MVDICRHQDHLIFFVCDQPVQPMPIPMPCTVAAKDSFISALSFVACRISLSTLTCSARRGVSGLC